MHLIVKQPDNERSVGMTADEMILFSKMEQRGTRSLPDEITRDILASSNEDGNLWR
jgi:hypothetical protein